MLVKQNAEKLKFLTGDVDLSARVQIRQHSKGLRQFPARSDAIDSFEYNVIREHLFRACKERSKCSNTSDCIR